MKMLLGCCLCLLLLLCVTGRAQSRTLHLGSCAVNIHVHELRKHYSTIRTSVISGDSDIAVRLLDKAVMKNIQEGQKCCFLRLLLRFYVERVFGNYASSEPQGQRCSSALANAFVTIRRDVHKCHCHCGEETQRTIDSLHTEFVKLQISQAAQKAVGELDTVLDWMDGLVHQASQ